MKLSSGNRGTPSAIEAQLWAHFHRLPEGGKDLVIRVVREITYQNQMASLTTPKN
jgi:hypothetical protein